MNTDTLSIVGPPDVVTLVTETGATGPRGSLWFTGAGMPSELTIPDYDSLKVGDMYIDQNDGGIYQMILLPSNALDWIKVGVSAAGGSLDTEGVQDVVGAMVAAAGGTYNDAAGTITLPSGGSSTITADDTPAAPAEGESASYFVTSAVVWPAGLVWSTDPDGGVPPTVTGTALVSMFTVGGATRAIMGATFPALPDTVTPVAGTLASSSITETGFTLAITGASDVGGLHAQPYCFDSGAGTFGAWQASASLAVTGKAAGTAYTAQHKVRDAAGNEATGASIVVTTATRAAPEVFAGLVAEFDARDLARLTPGDAVTTWAPHAGTVPSLTPTAGPVVYGVAGTRHFVRTGETGWLESDITNLAQPSTVVVAVSIKKTTSDVPIIGSSGLINALYLDKSGAGLSINAATALSSMLTPTLDTPHFFAARFNGESSSIWMDARQVFAGNAGSNERRTIKVGANTATTVTSDLEVSWIGLWPTALTNQDLLDVRAWLISEGVLPA